MHFPRIRLTSAGSSGTTLAIWAFPTTEQGGRRLHWSLCASVAGPRNRAMTLRLRSAASRDLVRRR
eukprot:2077781-Alexandrium_andersonii.AAC.1